MASRTPTDRTTEIIEAIRQHGVKYRMGKSLCIETPHGIWTLLAEDVEALVAYITTLERSR